MPGLYRANNLYNIYSMPGAFSHIKGRRRTAAQKISKFWKRTRARRAVDRRQNRNISKLYRMVKYSKEQKYIDQSQITSLSTSWVTLLPRDLTFIAQGTGGGSGVIGQRVGNKVKIHSHHIKIVVTGGDAINQYRIMVIRFLAQAASLIDLADALQTPAAASPLNLMTFKKRDTDSKYQVLWDSGIKFTEGTATAPTNATQKVHNIYLTNKGKGYFAGYNSSSAGGCVQGYTYIVGVSDSSIVTNPLFTCVSRTVFSG